MKRSRQVRGYFWLPCPVCGEYFSGADPRPAGMPPSIPDPDYPPGSGRGVIICPRCIAAGCGENTLLPMVTLRRLPDDEINPVPADAIVIPRADLAPVSIVEGRAVADGASDPYSASLDANPNWAWQYALNAIAVSEYLRAHPPTPPVDEADVEALAGLIRDDSQWAMRSTQRLARRLLATGKVTVTS